MSLRTVQRRLHQAREGHTGASPRQLTPCEEGDCEFWFDRRGNGLRKSIVIRKKRLGRIAETITALEREARADEAAAIASPGDAEESSETALVPSQKKLNWRLKNPPLGSTRERVQNDLTDPDWRMSMYDDKIAQSARTVIRRVDHCG